MICSNFNSWKVTVNSAHTEDRRAQKGLYGLTIFASVDFLPTSLHLGPLWRKSSHHLICLDYGTSKIADHALGLVLSIRRGILLHNGRQCQPHVAPWMYVDTPLVRRLQGATFGILGLGRIGTAAACLRAEAFR